MEPVERGIKVWECADSSTVMFVISMFTLRERNANLEQGLGYRIVHNLTRRFVAKNHHVLVEISFL